MSRARIAPVQKGGHRTLLDTNTANAVIETVNRLSMARVVVGPGPSSVTAVGDSLVINVSIDEIRQQLGL